MTVRIKICGITTADDAEAVGELGADFIGLNFYSRSPRYISQSRVADVLRAIPTSVEPVALFVNEPLGHVERSVRAIGIRTAQVHGDHMEIPPPAIRVIPAFPVRDEQSLHRVRSYLTLLESSHAALPSAILVDAHVHGMHGGTGQTAPWQLLADFDPGVPLILAGGLTPENVAEAIRIVRPWGVDVASGVESAPGRKDPEKLRRFIENARAAG
jgi:phosphoribosylanthranilate isomerase